MSKLGIGPFSEVDLVFTHKHEIGNAPVQIDGSGALEMWRAMHASQVTPQASYRLTGADTLLALTAEALLLLLAPPASWSRVNPPCQWTSSGILTSSDVPLPG
jgi:hypothetical protein